MPTAGSYVHTITQPTPIQVFGVYNEQGVEGNWSNLSLAAGESDGIYAEYLFADYVTEFFSPVLAGNLTAGTFNIGATAQIDSINFRITWQYYGGDLVTESDTGNMYLASVWDGTTRYSSLSGPVITSIGITQNSADSIASLTFSSNLPPVSVVNSTLGVRFQGLFNTIFSTGTECAVVVDSIYVTVAYSFPSSTGETGGGGSTGSTGSTGATGSTGGTGFTGGPPTDAVGSYGTKKKLKVVNGRLVDADEYTELERIFNFQI